MVTTNSDHREKPLYAKIKPRQLLFEKNFYFFNFFLLSHNSAIFSICRIPSGITIILSCPPLFNPLFCQKTTFFYHSL